MARHHQTLGQQAQRLVESVLRQMGAPIVQPIETGWAVQFRNGKPIKAWPKAKVAADIYGVWPDGRALLVEVKERLDRLRWSDLRPHQIENLNAYADLGAVALLAWVADEVYIMPWPVPGFGPRKSIIVAQAREHRITKIQ